MVGDNAMSTQYPFRRMDNDETIHVDFAAMFEKDILGEITVEIDGQSVRCRQIITEKRPPAPVEKSCVPPPMVSDALGFPACGLKKLEEDRVKHGFSGVSFREDPKVPGFYQTHFAGPEERKRYEKHCGYENMSSVNGSGAMLSELDFEVARQKAIEKYGVGRQLAAV